MQKDLKKIIKDSRSKPEPAKNSEKIRVNESVGKAAFYYEKLRNAIDWQDEHLFLKNAIKRILKRRIYLGQNQNKTAETLLKELIWAKYFENESIPVAYIDEVSAILKKYSFLRSKVSSSKSSSKVTEIVLGLVACEIEEFLMPSNAEQEYIDFTYNLIKADFDVKDDIDQNKLETYLKIDIFSGLFKADQDRLRYYLLKNHAKNWPNVSKQKTEEIAKDFDNIVQSIDKDIRFALSTKISKFVKHRLPPFRIIWEIIKKHSNAEEIIFDEDYLANSAHQIIREKNKNIYKKVFNSITRGIIFILLTKVIMAFLIELPYELRILGEANYLALGINTLFPPALMLITSLFIRIPGAKNTQQLIGYIESICLEGEFSKGKITSLNGKRSRSYIIFDIFNSLLSLAIISLVTWGLISLGFNTVSIVLFFIFTSLVSFLGFRISAIANELEVRTKEENLLTGFYNLIFMPFVAIGRFLSDKWSSYNFTLFFWDFIVEAPFKAIISLFESWLAFMREKREEFE